MDTRIVIVILFLLLTSILFFVYKYKTSTQPVTQKSAICNTENEDSNYNFSDERLLGSDIVNNSEYFSFLNLSPTIITNKSSLVSNTYYQKGTLKSGVTSTINPSKNGGAACTEFPTTIYKPVNWSWQQVPNVNVPVSLNENGNVQCLSTDGVNCLWGTLLNKLPTTIKPLVCSSYTGNSWCYLGMKGLNPSSPKIATTDPCSGYTDSSTNVSIYCLRKIWEGVGCINSQDTTVPDSYDSNWVKSQTKAAIVSSMNSFKTLPDDQNRELCYGSDRTIWPAYPPSPVQYRLYRINWYPFNASKIMDKLLLGIDTVEQAQNYAYANNYTTFAFNPNPTPDAIDSQILFFTDDEIIWLNGAYNTEGFFKDGWDMYTSSNMLLSDISFKFDLITNRNDFNTYSLANANNVFNGISAIGCWIKLNADVTNGIRPGIVMGNYPYTDSNGQNQINVEIHMDRRPRIYMNNGAINWLPNDNLPIDSWAHIFFVIKPSTIEYYRDGVLKETFTGTVPVISQVTGIKYGYDNRGSDTVSGAPKFQIAKMYVDNSLPNAAEVKRIMSYYPLV